MPWYFAKNGQPHGPISDAEFEDMTVHGTITPGMLVWREGMATWQPWSAVRGVGSPVAPILDPIPATGRTCRECGREFPEEELVQILGQSVCGACKSLHLQRLLERGTIPAAGATSGVWRQGKLLILQTGAELPPRCVRCNLPATWAERIKLSWNPEWIYLTILFSVIVVVLVAFFTRKTVTVVMPLCEAHRHSRAVWRFVSGATVAAGLLMMGLGWLIGPDAGVVGLMLGILIALIGVVVSSRASWVLTPRRIDKEFARLKGCCPEFLDCLPPFPGT